MVSKLKQRTVGARQILVRAGMRLLTPKTLVNFREWEAQTKLVNSTPRPMTRMLKEHFGDKALVGVEIGLGCGVNALSMLQELNLKTLYEVELGIEYTYYGRKISGYSQRFEETCQQFTSYPQFKLLIGDSQKMSHFIPEQVDFVYIDGNHERLHVLEDFWAYYPLVRTGGVIGGHDITTDYFSVMEALIEIGIKLGHSPNTQIPDWWFIKKEESD